MDEEVIKKAKLLAAKKKISLSGLIENYLEALISEQTNDIEISVFVKSIATGTSIPASEDGKGVREDYTDYLDKKYR